MTRRVPRPPGRECAETTRLGAEGARLGKTVSVTNQSRHDGARSRDIADQLRSGELADLLAGADGRRPTGPLLADDYTHPSQAGNDRIRDVLLEAALLG